MYKKSVLFVLSLLFLPLLCPAVELTDEIVWLKLREDIGNPGDIINSIFTPGDTSILVTGTAKFIEIDALTGAFKREIPGIRGAYKFSDDNVYVYTYDGKKVDYLTGEVVGQFPKWGFSAFDINEKAGIMIGVANTSDHDPSHWKKGIFVYDLNTFQLIDTLGFDKNYYYGIKITDDGKYFQTYSQYVPDWTHPENNGSYDLLWDAKTLQVVQAPEFGHIKVSPDGQWLGSGEYPYVRVYNYNTFEKVYQWDPDNGSCSNDALDFTPDSKYLVTGGPDCEDARKISIWDLAKGELSYKYNEEIGPSKLLISTDNHILALGSGGLALLNWMLPTGVPEIQKKSTILYPNPTSGIIILQNSSFNAGQLRIELLDNSGKSLKILFNNFYQQNNLNFDLSGYPTGVYFLKATQNNKVITYKIIKEK